MRILATEKQSYERRKLELLDNSNICKENQDLFKKFLNQHEIILKRKRNLSKLDEPNYKTLNKYVGMFSKLNEWFENKPLIDINKNDITRVYNGLEDGKITQSNGKPYSLASRITYYNKIFKSELFRMIKKEHLSKSVMKYTTTPDEEVRYLDEEGFNKIILNINNPEHKTLLWLSWDIGENINSLLKLKKNDFIKQTNPHTKEPEYKINLKKEILKRSRRARGEITNYKETVLFLEQLLNNLEDDELLFKYGYNNAKKILQRAVDKGKAKALPNNSNPTWKDIRSGMACHLLIKGWTTDEVNARLGHRPSSTEIDKYVNFLALDRHTPKKKVHEFELSKLNDELNKMKELAKLENMRKDSEIQRLKSEHSEIKEMIKDLWKQGIIKK